MTVSEYPSGNNLGVVHQVNSFEIGGRHTGACAVSAVHQATVRERRREGFSQPRLRHRPCQDKGVPAHHPQELEMAEAIGEALQIIEVRTKIQLLTLEAEGTQVIRFPGKDA